MTERGNFSGRIGFILAAAGSAVGLGNIWRFPYLAGQNGGAIFLIFYLLCIFLLCYPVMVGEIAIGRRTNSDPYGAYTKLGGKGWGWLGIFGILAGIFILSFYNVVAGWAFGYFLEISFSDLLSVGANGITTSAGEVVHDQAAFGQFFGSYVNDISDNFWFSLVFMALTAIIVSQGIQKGIEAANKIMMPALYVILIGLIIYSLTLPNALDGVANYLIPDFSELKSQTIFDGLRQAFFSLSLGMGALITYGSYLSKKENIVSSAAVISMADTSVAFLAGLMVFPMMAATGNYEKSGPELIFVVLTNVFSHMDPLIGRIVGGSFFLLICFAALTSTISLLEVPVAYFVDQRKFPRRPVVWATAALVFILGIPSMISQGMVPALNKLPFYQNRDFLTFVSDMCDLSLTLGGCFMSIFIARTWKISSLDQELTEGNPSYPRSVTRLYLNMVITYISPVLLGTMSVLIIIDKFFGLANLIPGWR